jgi:hypothetical protein
MLWTRTQRARYVEFPSRADNVEEYIEDMVDAWHTSPADIGLANFLGMTWEEYGPWTSKGIVPDRITLMWITGDY